MSDSVGSNENPVLNVYDLHRTARLNKKYYESRLALLEKQTFWMELSLAIPGSSTIAGLWIWTSTEGKIVWTIVGVATTILGVVKSLSKYTDKIRKMEKVLAGYTALEGDLEKLVLQIKHDREYSQSLQKQFFAAIDRKRTLASERVESKPDTALVTRLVDEVNKELPPASYYVPSKITE